MVLINSIDLCKLSRPNKKKSCKKYIEILVISYQIKNIYYHLSGKNSHFLQFSDYQGRVLLLIQYKIYFPDKIQH